MKRIRTAVVNGQSLIIDSTDLEFGVLPMNHTPDMPDLLGVTVHSAPDEGLRWRLLRYPPNVFLPMHSTQSIDYFVRARGLVGADRRRRLVSVVATG